MTTVTPTTTDKPYYEFIKALRENFTALCAQDVTLYRTNVERSSLWDAYLSAFDGDEKQHHNCNTCRHFIQSYGGLVTIDEHGNKESALWSTNNIPAEYVRGVVAMAALVHKADVFGMFLSGAPTWGNPVTGDWKHLSVTLPLKMLYNGYTKSAAQRMAEKSEDFRNTMRVLQDYDANCLAQAVKLLKSGKLNRSEKVLEAAAWLQDLHRRFSEAKGKQRTNIVWRTVAVAPVGFCHIRAGVLGTLLDDVKAGKAFEDLSNRFAAKMDPTLYLRPQAAPRAGAIAEAEKIVAQIGAAGSLDRRYCRPDEVTALWRPQTTEAQKPEGVFGHLEPKGKKKAAAVEIPAIVMTWTKFERTVLPDAVRMEIKVPRHGDFITLVTAANMDAPPIIQWDQPEARNPVSWYVWRGGAPATQYGLIGNQYYDVSLVTLKPSMWQPNYERHGRAVIFAIAGALEHRMYGNALFPELLRGEYHGVRSVIEAYARTAVIAGKEGPHVVGLSISITNTREPSLCVRVTSAGGTQDYEIDRWD